MKRLTILIIDDHTLVRQGWCMVLNSDKRFQVVAESGDAESALEVSRQLRPDIVLIDINLPGMSGIEALPLIRKFSPASKILVISLHAIPGYVRKAMKHGASGYVTKNSSKEEMIDAILKVYQGEKYICRHIKEVIAAQMTGETDPVSKLSTLSPRELEIISCLRQGMISKEIAEQLHITVKTVEVHRFNILKKLELKNTASLVHFISRHHTNL
jgi:DNA-binding NarL/FixJ family response regulator